MRSFWIIVLIGALATDLSAAVAEDEPYLAVRTGFKCSQCHTNRTGGGKRSDFGNIFTQTRLPMTVVGAPGSGAFMTPQLSEYLSIGGNLRVTSSRQFTGDEPKSGIEVSSGNVYVEARVIPDILSIYVDEALAPGSPRNRELFVLVGGLPGSSYVKAGKFFLPFGLRLQADDEFIRQRTGFNFDNSDEGLELGFEPGPLSLAVAVTNGTQGAAENNSDKQFSGRAALVFSDFRLGASGSHNDAPLGQRDVVGAFGGLRLGRFAFLAEFDYIFDDAPDGQSNDQFAAFVEGDWLIARGWNAKVTYGFLDPDRDVGENARTQLRIGLEPFITQFLQASVFYTVLEDIPQADTDRDRLTLELHGFF